jgi:hypothetical protein
MVFYLSLISIEKIQDAPKIKAIRTRFAFILRGFVFEWFIDNKNIRIMLYSKAKFTNEIVKSWLRKVKYRVCFDYRLSIFSGFKSWFLNLNSAISWNFVPGLP